MDYRRTIRRWTRVIFWAALLSWGLCSIAFADHAKHPPLVVSTCQVRALHSPHGGSASALVRLLGRAKKTVHVAIYGLTHPALVTALIDAQKRGALVIVKADKVQSAGKAQKAMIAKLRDAGVTVEVSEQSRLLHHKFVVVDGRWVATGSFNWTVSAENRNREHLVVLDCPEVARQFIEEWGFVQPKEP